jgi:hypothetical protein
MRQMKLARKIEIRGILLDFGDSGPEMRGRVLLKDPYFHDRMGYPNFAEALPGGFWKRQMDLTY